MRGYYGDITGIDGGLHGVCCSLLLAADGHRDERACAEDRKAVALAPRPAFDEIFSAARAFVATQALTRKQQNRPQKSGLGGMFLRGCLACAGKDECRKRRT